MHLSDLMKRQTTADERRGFTTHFENSNQQYDMLAHDLVGLMGEIGEFANQLKKVGLGLSNERYSGPSLKEASPHLREELADAAIYLMRLSAGLGGDLEQDILRKMDINDERYRDLER